MGNFGGRAVEPRTPNPEPRTPNPEPRTPNPVNDRLQEIADELASVPRDLQVELLLEHARQFPPLPQRYQAARDAGLGRVHECQAEVYFFPEVTDDQHVHIHADIPGHAPTQRALVGILMDAYDGAPPAEVATIPNDLLRLLGVDGLLGPQRQRGFAGVLARLKHGVAEAAGPASEAAGSKSEAADQDGASA